MSLNSHGDKPHNGVLDFESQVMVVERVRIPLSKDGLEVTKCMRKRSAGPCVITAARGGIIDPIRQDLFGPNHAAVPLARILAVTDAGIACVSYNSKILCSLMKHKSHEDFNDPSVFSPVVVPVQLLDIALQYVKYGTIVTTTSAICLAQVYRDVQSRYEPASILAAVCYLISNDKVGPQHYMLMAVVQQFWTHYSGFIRFGIEGDGWTYFAASSMLVINAVFGSAIWQRTLTRVHDFVLQMKLFIREPKFTPRFPCGLCNHITHEERCGFNHPTGFVYTAKRGLRFGVRALGYNPCVGGFEPRPFLLSRSGISEVMNHILSYEVPDFESIVHRLPRVDESYLYTTPPPHVPTLSCTTGVPLVESHCFECGLSVVEPSGYTFHPQSEGAHDLFEGERILDSDSCADDATSTHVRITERELADERLNFLASGIQYTHDTEPYILGDTVFQEGVAIYHYRIVDSVPMCFNDIPIFDHSEFLHFTPHTTLLTIDTTRDLGSQSSELMKMLRLGCLRAAAHFMI